ncbi:MAG: hypothetical protein ABI520_01965 [Caldimonas sp.]
MTPPPLAPPLESAPAPLRIAPAWPALSPRARLPLLALGFAALLVGVGAGLARLGAPVPAFAASSAPVHGPLMVCGFFGVVIALERAVALGRGWAYLGPLFAALGVVTLLSGGAGIATWLFLAGSVVLLAATLDVLRRQRALFVLTLALAAACLVIGNAQWAFGRAPAGVLSWWLAFLVLTIAGERLELSRFLPPSPIARRAFALLLIAVGAGLAAGDAPWGPPLFGAGLLGLAAWLLKQDIARRTVHGRGLTRFIAVCLLSGYGWLAVGAALWLGGAAGAPGSNSHDAALHAITLGFVFSMVFGHAAIILPAITKFAVPYHPTFYVPLALLQVSLLVRLGGDAAGRIDWTRAGAWLNAAALAAFLLGTLAAVLRGRRKPT